MNSEFFRKLSDMGIMLSQYPTESGMLYRAYRDGFLVREFTDTDLASDQEGVINSLNQESLEAACEVLRPDFFRKLQELDVSIVRQPTWGGMIYHANFKGNVVLSFSDKELVLVPSWILRKIEQKVRPKRVFLISGYTTDNNGNHGSIGAGKTTIANELAKRLDATVLSFATPLKEACKALGVDKGHHKFRALIKRVSEVADEVLGTDWIGEAALKAVETNQSVIFDDWRRSWDCIPLATQYDVIISIQVRRNISHCVKGVYENQNFESDIVVENNGTVEECVDEIMKKLEEMDGS